MNITKPSDEYIKKFRNAIEDFGPYKPNETLHIWEIRIAPT